MKKPAGRLLSVGQRRKKKTNEPRNGNDAIEGAILFAVFARVLFLLSVCVSATSKKTSLFLALQLLTKCDNVACRRSSDTWLSPSVFSLLFRNHITKFSNAITEQAVELRSSISRS